MRVTIEETARTRASVAGVVTDGTTGRPLAGARVEVVAGPVAFRDRLELLQRQHGAAWEAAAARFDRAEAGPDGHFHLRGLPPGKYTLRACLPGAGRRFGPAREQVRVTDDEAIAEVSIALPATVVRGRVTGRGGAPVALAEVRLRGSAERAYTDRDGRFVLAGVESGERTVEVAARGYAPARLPVPLARPGWERELHFKLSPPTP